MKKTLSILAAAALLFLFSCKKEDAGGGSASAEAISVIPQTAVPAAVVSSFNARFSGATEIEWHRSAGLFHAEFNQNNQRHSSSFDDSGHHNEDHLTCTSGAVPAAVLSAFRARNPNDNVYEWKLTSAGTWKAHFNRNGVKWETTFSAAGNFISEEHD